MRARLSFSLLIKIILAWLLLLVMHFAVDSIRSTSESLDANKTIHFFPFGHMFSPKADRRLFNTTSGFNSFIHNETTSSSAASLQCSNTSYPTARWVNGLPPIYMITPTYRRAEQIAELTRTAQTLLLVNNLVWIVAEDAPTPSPEVIDYLSFCGIKSVYLRAQMPKKFAKVAGKPRGVANRNAGIKWIRENAPPKGVVYFGDDDNTYDIRIFEEIRSTKKVSMFPVGLVTNLGVSTPIVKGGKVIGFYDGWIAKRKFPVDMAGFAISVQLFKEHPTAFMPYIVGYEEDKLLQALHINISDIEPKAENCTKIWVWHTQTKKNNPVNKAKLKMNLKETNIPVVQKALWQGV